MIPALRARLNTQNMFPRFLRILDNIQSKEAHIRGLFINATSVNKQVFSTFIGKHSHTLTDSTCFRLASSTSSTGSDDLLGFKRFTSSFTKAAHCGQHRSEKRNKAECVTILPSRPMVLVRNATRLLSPTNPKAWVRREQLLHNVANFHHQPSTRCMASKASKAGKGKQKQQRISEDTNSDDESYDDIIKRDEDDLERDWDPEIDEKLSADEQEAGASPEWKEMQQYVPSLRLDAVFSAGLGVSRKKIEEAYLSTRLRVNGEKVSKKSRQVKEGDILDMILERSTPSQAKEGDVNADGLTVMRLHIMEISTDRTSKDRVPVLLRRWKNLRLSKEKK